MTILVIDTDASVRTFIGAGFKAEGYSVLSANDAAEGAKLATRYPLKAIIMETILPFTSGFELCSKLRSYGVDAPILFLSSRDTVADRINGLRHGADDYMIKPFSFEELLARTEALGRRSQRYNERRLKLRVGDLVYDRETLNVTRGRRSIELTSKELSILELFMAAPGKVFSRARILSNVWGAGADPASNIVDVYIGKLRRKIDTPGDDRLIETIRNRGYRIIDVQPQPTTAREGEKE
ncbi:MAG: response regulator transcription factor [Pseudomonadota bacterium]